MERKAGKLLSVIIAVILLVSNCSAYAMAGDGSSYAPQGDTVSGPSDAMMAGVVGNIIDQMAAEGIDTRDSGSYSSDVTFLEEGSGAGPGRDDADEDGVPEADDVPETNVHPDADDSLETAGEGAPDPADSAGEEGDALSAAGASGTFGDYEYEILNGSYASITKYKGGSAEVTIPSRVGTYEVQSVGVSAFENNTVLTKVTIPKTVETIGKSAFKGCSALTDVAVENDSILTTIRCPGYGQMPYCKMVLHDGRCKTESECRPLFCG